MGLLFCCFFMFPGYQVAAQEQNLPRPTKSTKFYFNGAGYVIYLNVDKSIVREIIDEDYDIYIKNNKAMYGVEGNDKYGYEVEAYFFANKKKKIFDTQDYQIGKGKVYCITMIDYKYTGRQGFAYRYRLYTIDENGKKIYSDYSKETVIVPYVTGNSMKIERGNEITVYWSKMKGAKSYTVYLCEDGGKRSKKIATTKKNYVKINKNKFKRNIYYYYYVQANGIKYKNKKYNSTKKLKGNHYIQFLYVYR